MFGIGTSEFLVIVIVAVLVLGPEHLPRIMRTFTRVMSEIRRVSKDFQRTLNFEATQEERRQQQASAAARPGNKNAASGAKGSPASATAPDDPEPDAATQDTRPVVPPAAPPGAPPAGPSVTEKAPDASGDKDAALAPSPSSASEPSGAAPADGSAAETGAPPAQGDRT